MLRLLDWDSFLYEPFTAVTIPVNITETKEKYTLEFNLAGYKQKELSVEFKNGALHITGKRITSTDQTYLRRDFCRLDSFEKTFSFDLLRSATPSDITASFDDGVLTITINKKDIRKQIDISSKKLLT